MAVPYVRVVCAFLIAGALAFSAGVDAAEKAGDAASSSSAQAAKTGKSAKAGSAARKSEKTSTSAKAGKSTRTGKSAKAGNAAKAGNSAKATSTAQSAKSPVASAGPSSTNTTVAHVLPRTELEPEDEPDEAQRFFLKKRLPPGMKNYPAAKLLKAREHAQKLPLYSSRIGGNMAAPEGSKAAQSLTWTSLGPGNIGGRTRAFRMDPVTPTTIYAAGVAGGVWKTTNSGASWTPLGDGMANMAVTALLVDPSNTSVIYAGTGEGYFNVDGVQGAGIFKSTDGGANWNQIASTNNADFAFVNDLAFNPANSAQIYAATGDGLWRSTNSGTSWTLMVNASDSLGCMKVVYRSDVDTAVATCGTFSSTAASTGIWRSTNASAASPTWTHVVGPSGSGATQTQANMGRASIAIAPSNQAVMYALVSCYPSGSNQCGTGNAYAYALLAVLQSTDGGASWTTRRANTFTQTVNSNLLLTNPVIARCSVCTIACGAGASDSLNNQGWYDNVIAVDPADSTKVWVGGIDLWRSDDSGATFGVASYWWFNTTDAQYSHADQHGIIFDPGFNGTSNTTMYVTSDGGLFKTTNARAAVGTNTTATNNNSVCGFANLSAINFSNLNNSYGVTQYYHGTVYPSGTQYFAGAQDNGTTRGTDGSPNGWTSIRGGDGGFTGIDRTSSGGSTVLYAETTGVSIAKSTNNGGSFGSFTSGISNTGCGQFINPFQVDPNNNQRLWTSHNVLWRVLNPSSTWTQASAAITGTSCTGVPSDTGERFTNYAIAPGNSDLLIAGTDNGRICRLTNATSSTSSTALANCTQPEGAGVYVSEIAFDPNNNATAYAALSTFGVDHVLKSTNSGQTWAAIPSGANPLPDSPTHTVAVSPADASGNTIYVGTEIGVFVTTDGGANWARENTGFANVITDHLAFNFVDPDWQLYAFTHGRGVFRTTLASNLDASTTTLSSSPDPSVFGQNVTLTATVSGASGTPTGTVTFKDGASTLQSGVALVAGTATFQTTALSTGTHASLSAVYSGDATYAGSTGNDSHTVNKASTSVSISSDNPDPSVVGQSVTVAASVAVTSPGAGTPTGSITITGSNTTGCTINPLSNGSCTLTFTATGAQTLDASYGGDTNFNASSTAASTSHTVNKANTTVSITSDNPDPSVVGQSVTVAASVAVTSPGSGTPTGSITITGSNTTGCTINPLSNGSCTLTFTAPGAQTLDASYGGDTKFNGSSTAASTSHTVNKANSTVSITSDLPDPSVVGQSVTVAASVAAASPGSGTPTGSITITGSNTTGCTINPLSNGSCSLTFTAAGAQTLNASYGGDSNFNGSSTSSSTAHTVNKAATSVSISDDTPDPSVVGQSVTVSAAVAVTSPGAGTPTGTITITGTNTTGCTITPLSNGSCSLTFTAAGAQTLSASYGGDTNFSASSTAATTPHTVNKANTTVSIGSDNPDPSVVGQSVTVAASVAVTAPGGGTPTGTITITGTNTTGCTITPLSNGSCTLTFTAPGSQTLDASYGGDANYNGSSTSSSTSHTVNKASTSVSITSDNPDPSVVGQSVTVAASVAVTSPGSGTPTGTITITGSNTTGCTITPLSNGSCSLTFTAAGAQTLDASYGGDTNFNGSSTAASTSHTVNKAATTVSIGGDSPDPSVVGQSVTVSASVAVTSPGAGTPTGTITITGSNTSGCTITPLSNGSCSLTFTAAGAQTLNASYGGDGDFSASSTAAPTAHTVNKAATTVSISDDTPDPSVVGQSVSVSAAVAVTAPGAGTPTGTITITGSNTTGCTITPLSNGSCSLTFTAAGAQTLNASYGGDANFSSSSTAGSTAHAVNKASTSVSIGGDTPDPSVVGQSVTVSAAVAVTAPGGGTPTGSITITGSNTTGCTISPLSNGSCSLTFTAAGAQTLDASYGGDANYNASSTAASTSHAVNKAGTSVSISDDSPDPSVVGQSVTVSASVAASAPGGGTPTGSITITGSNTTGCTINPLSDGSCSLTFTAPGAQTLNASYGGDANFNASSTAAPTAHTVNKAATTVSISGDSPDPSVVGQSVTVSASVAVSGSGSGTPTGTITITGSNTTGCTISPLSNGSCSLTFTAAGAQTLNASYGGDANFGASSTAAPTSHTVNKAATTVSISDDTPDPSVVGQSVTVSAAVAVTDPGAGTPTGSITISGTDTAGCTINPLSNGSCSLTFTSAGAKTITATYNGDANFSTSASAPATPHAVTPTADLRVSIDDGVAIAPIGTQVTYTIVVTNDGPDDVTGATLTDSPPAGLVNLTWTCSPAGKCANVSGVGAIDESVDLNSGASLTYHLTGTVTVALGTHFANSAQIAAPVDAIDPNNANDSATDEDDTDDIFNDAFEPAEP